MMVDELAAFIIDHVEGLEEGIKKDEEAGHGAYGVVYKVTVRGVPCIAKRLHKLLVNQMVPTQEKGGIVEKFRQECILLSKLRHPNIVHFIGVHYGKEQNDLTLLMECLESDLADYIDRHENVPLSIKLSILLDVSSGMLYLHTHNPPVIHRDLTARNVLVTSDGRAKIADLGVAKLLDERTLAATSHTQNPGQHFYMPPEALRKDAACTPKLDIFSFGHLALYTLNQQCPVVYEIDTKSVSFYYQAIVDGTVQILKRQEALDQVGKGHCMYEVMTQCLRDEAGQRPSTYCLHQRMVELYKNHRTTLEDWKQVWDGVVVTTDSQGDHELTREETELTITPHDEKSSDDKDYLHGGLTCYEQQIECNVDGENETQLPHRKQSNELSQPLQKDLQLEQENDRDKAKLLIMGESEDAITMRNIIFARYDRRDTRKLNAQPPGETDLEQRYLHSLLDTPIQICFKNDKQQNTVENSSTDQRSTFENTAVFVYIHDVENVDVRKDLDHYQSCLEAIAQLSSKVKIFCLIHKLDLIPEDQRDMIFDRRKHEFKSRSLTLDCTCFGTSIWDETLYKAWSSIIKYVLPNKHQIQSSLDNLARILDADEVVLFERRTLLVIAHSIHRPHPDSHRFEKLSNILKLFQLQLICSKLETQFRTIEVRNSCFVCVIEVFTPNTYVMVVTSDSKIGSATLLSSIRKASKYFEKFI